MCSIVQKVLKKHVLKSPYLIKLITKARKNMKPKKLSKQEQALLRCRGVIETVIGQLKEMHHIENTKIRSLGGWIMNILGALTAYQIRAFKPSVKPVIYSDSSLIRNEV